MADPIYSPDGKFMWSGSEWIPAPPTSEPEPQSPSEQTLNMQDSVIGGDVVQGPRAGGIRMYGVGEDGPQYGSDLA